MGPRVANLSSRASPRTLPPYTTKDRMTAFARGVVLRSQCFVTAPDLRRSIVGDQSSVYEHVCQNPGPLSHSRTIMVLALASFEFDHFTVFELASGQRVNEITMSDDGG